MARDDDGRFRWALRDHARNRRLVDVWSFIHVLACGALALVVGPWIAFLIALVWEPFEIFVVSPVAAWFGVEFGYEDWRNSVSDVAFNALGVVLAAYAVLPYWNPFGV